jgi:hypothetical protein
VIISSCRSVTAAEAPAGGGPPRDQRIGVDVADCRSNARRARMVVGRDSLKSECDKTATGRPASG